MRPKILFRKKRKKKNQKISQIWRRVKHRTHDVYTNGVDNKTNSLDLTRVLLLERTHERVKNELKNERMNETAFDSIARSFFRSLFAKRERTRARKSIAFSHHRSSSSNVENIIHRDFSFTARARCLKERERCAKNMRRTRTTPPRLTEL